VRVESGRHLLVVRQGRGRTAASAMVRMDHESFSLDGGVQIPVVRRHLAAHAATLLRRRPK
jgi:hypothetical protein